MDSVSWTHWCSTQHAILNVLNCACKCPLCVRRWYVSVCCPLLVQVTTTPVHLRPAHLLSMKCCTGFNAMIRKMVILMNTFLRQMALAVLVVFLSVSSLLHEEMLALSARRRGQKAASSPGMHAGCYGKSIPCCWCKCSTVWWNLTSTSHACRWERRLFSMSKEACI